MSTSGQNLAPARAGPRVFISYRRGSDQAYARLLRQELAREFGDEAVFRDVERIEGGEKFLPTIQAALAGCNTFLALISPYWLEATKRLHDPEDFVRMEVAAALASGVRVIPVLLGGAQVPEKKALPADIKELTAYQAEELRDSRWEDDVRNLVAAIRAPFAATTQTPPTPLERIRRAPARLYPVAFMVLLLAAAFAVWRVASKTNGNTNVNSNVTPTPFPTRTPAHTPTPTATPAPSEKCFEELMPEGRWVRIEYGDPDYRVAVEQGQPKAGEAGFVFAEEGKDIGAIKVRYVQSGKDQGGNPTGFFRIVKVIGPKCLPVEAYTPPPAVTVIETFRGYDWVDVQLGERHYNLRIANTNDTIVAVFKPR